MSKKELKQSNKDLEFHVVDLIAKFDPSHTGKFTQFLLKKLREKWEEPQPRKMKLKSRYDVVRRYERPSSINPVEDTILYYLHEMFGVENMECLHSLHDHLENNRVDGNRDINQYKNWEEIQKANALATIKYEQKRLEKEVIKVYEDDNWLVVRPLTFESSLTYGAGTKWCTASKSNREYFYKYCGNGVLSYVINKNDGDKYGIFYDIHNNQREFSVWNAPDQRIDSSESNIPFEIMKIVLKMSKSENTNMSYFSDEEVDRSGWGMGKKAMRNYEGAESTEVATRAEIEVGRDYPTEMSEDPYEGDRLDTDRGGLEQLLGDIAEEIGEETETMSEGDYDESSRDTEDPNIDFRNYENGR